MQIRDAIPRDIPEILEIYESAKKALREAGIDQWQGGYPNEESLREDIDGGISRVCIEDGRIIATAAAYVGHEPTYEKILEGRWLTDSTEYGLVHRIAVSPQAKGGGVASAVMEYTAGLAKAAGVKSLRCDTHRHNLIMQKTLLKNGYRYCGIIFVEDGTERFAYERLAEKGDC